MAWDILIRGGTVIDGSGRPGERADVAIAGGRVAILEANYASVSFRVDRLGDRLDRIERRLGLVDA